MRNTYGQRGGTGANAGRTSVLYEATLPDGTVVQKKSFQVDQPMAVIGCYQARGTNKWTASGVWSVSPGFDSQVFVEARRISLRFIDEVCNLFDVEVLCDMEAVNPADENDDRFVSVIALGSRAEHGAGLTGFVMTPWFKTQDELNEFLLPHIHRLREFADANAPVPNMVDWSVEVSR